MELNTYRKWDVDSQLLDHRDKLLLQVCRDTNLEHLQLEAEPTEEHQ